MKSAAISPQETPRLDKYGYNCISKHVALAVFISAPLFLGAGTLDWGWAWLYAAVTLIGWIALSAVLARVNPELLNVRGQRTKALVGTKRWDWVIMTVYALLLLVTPFVAGLDYGNGWSPATPDALKWLGLAALAFGFVPLTWSMAVNRNFEGTVRIQSNRGHNVITSGPYRYVRHPGYVGVILHFIAVPLSLGTLWAWIPALLGVGLYVIRTALEDRTLQAELPGYTEFTRQTRFRLLPGVW